MTATYTLTPQGAVVIDYEATTDAPTVVNLSNHAYFNLAGAGGDRSVLDHRIAIYADAYTPVREDLIPTGAMAPVAGTVFDLREGRRIGDGARAYTEEQVRIGRGYDHNFVVGEGVSEAPRLVARVTDPASGRTLDVRSTQPGLQFYSGNFLDGTIAGPEGRAYRQGDAFALEPQMFPDAVNQPGFGSIRLAPGETYTNTIVFEPGVSDDQ